MTFRLTVHGLKSSKYELLWAIVNQPDVDHTNQSNTNGSMRTRTVFQFVIAMNLR